MFLRIPVRVDAVGAVSGFERTLERVTGVVLPVAVTFVDSSSSDSSSELDSSSEDSDSSFLAAPAPDPVGVVDPDWRKRD